LGNGWGRGNSPPGNYKASQKLGLSARAHSLILKVARTIADLANAPEMGIEHISEATR
jgi:magnesium chelatase family protein